MELTTATRKTITKAQAVRYRNGSRAVKSEILDVVCAVTGYHRDYARRALRLALTPRVVKARARRSPKYDSEVVAALEKYWAVANAPAGKRLAPLLAELVPVLRAEARPATVRSEISSRSNSAKAAKMPKTSLPAAVVVVVVVSIAAP